jgi:hypothetical protein
MRAQRRPHGGQGSEKPSAGRRGPKIKQEKLSQFGAELYPFIEAKNWGYGEIAGALGLKDAGNQVIGRMLRGETLTFPFTLDALLRAL